MLLFFLCISLGMYIRVLYSCSDEHERVSLVHELLVYVNKRTKVDLKQNTPSNLNGNELYMLYLSNK